MARAVFSEQPYGLSLKQRCTYPSFVEMEKSGRATNAAALDPMAPMNCLRELAHFGFMSKRNIQIRYADRNCIP